MGDKFTLLQEAINNLFNSIGTILKISPVYTSPAMGFEGEDFLNCVVLAESNLSPSKILKRISEIEKKLGRLPKKTKEYTSRPIDIDILFYGETTLETEALTIPHPELQNRKFVLQPLADVNQQLLHPILKKNIIRLLAETKDKSETEKLNKWLHNPIRDFDISKFNYIAIEGNIGAGKTSLAKKIAHDYNAKLILERFKDNPFLPKFYQDSTRYAFPLEMSFLADRYQQLLDDITQYDIFKDFVISDYDSYKSLIFAKVTLQDEEFNLYKKLFHLMHKELAKPDIYVYLYQDTERLLQNIKKRGRKYEESIKAEYLQKINAGYLEFIKTLPPERVKLIDVSEMDFIKNRADYLKVLKQIVV